MEAWDRKDGWWAHPEGLTFFNMKAGTHGQCVVAWKQGTVHLYEYTNQIGQYKVHTLTRTDSYKEGLAWVRAMLGERLIDNGTVVEPNYKIRSAKWGSK